MKTILRQLTNSLLFKVHPNHLHRQHSYLEVYAILHLLFKICTILGSLVQDIFSRKLKKSSRVFHSIRCLVLKTVVRNYFAMYLKLE